MGLSQKEAADPAVQMSDCDLRSGWKLLVVQAEVFSFGDNGSPVVSGDTIKGFFSRTRS